MSAGDREEPARFVTNARERHAGERDAGTYGEKRRPVADVTRELEPCLRCGTLLPLRVFGCKGGRCPNCGHAYPHGDCSD